MHVQGQRGWKGRNLDPSKGQDYEIRANIRIYGPRSRYKGQHQNIRAKIQILGPTSEYKGQDPNIKAKNQI